MTAGSRHQGADAATGTNQPYCMKTLKLTITHEQAILLEELLSTTITASAEAVLDEEDAQERALQRQRLRMAEEMHNELDRQARDKVMGW